jgi:predicted flap endonuclease-1-like 5' DNA nuclease
MTFVQDNWPLILTVAAVVLILAFLLLRPRQRVRLTDSAPVRPHMMQAPAEGRGVAGKAAAAASDVTGEIIGARVHEKLDAMPGRTDDLVQMKGVGPKFADMLSGLGFQRFDQLASLSQTEIDRLDSQLGPFRGRIMRDRIVEQADYLARKDIDGYEQAFGKL